MSLPYFKEFGWIPTVVAVKPEFIEAPIDNNLLLTVPSDVTVYSVNAFKSSYTRKFGLGNLGFRSFIQLLLKCYALFRKEKYDLIYISTTAFPVMALGRLLKFLFRKPFILDIQDPWRQDFYLDKPKHEQPPKFKYAYKVDSFLERFTVPYADGIIAVSDGYINTFHKRYPSTLKSESETITFGASEIDMKVLENINFINKYFSKNKGILNLLYVGRGGYDLHYSLNILFKAIERGLSEDNSLFSKIKLHFIGTSYAKNGTGTETIKPLAEKYQLNDIVNEVTDRIPYFEALFLLSEADLLIVPGSTDINYTASKLYPYILSKKNILTIFHENSSVNEIITSTRAGRTVTFNLKNDDTERLINATFHNLQELINKPNLHLNIDWSAFSKFTSRHMTQRQTDVFDRVLRRSAF
ncbi:hypothetical protein GCM10027293_06000 [Pontibacter aydingkolensis]